MSRPQPPVFFDPTGKRRRRVNVLGGLLVAALLVGGGLSVWALWTGDSIPELLESLVADTPTETANLKPGGQGPGLLYSAVGEPGVAASVTPLEATAFYVAWDHRSRDSLRRNINQIDVLVSEWWHLDVDGGLLLEEPTSNLAMLTEARTAKLGLAVMPLINNYNPRTQAWDSEALTGVMTHAGKRVALQDTLLAEVREHNFAGLNLDFEEVAPEAVPGYLLFVQKLSESLHADGKKLTIDAPMNNGDFPYAKLAKHADSLVLMAYDEHEGSSKPGAVASQGWIEKHLRQRLKEVPAEKLTLALGGYGYDWAGPGQGVTVSFQEALEQARTSGVQPYLDRQTLNPTFTYSPEKEGEAQHTVWYLDGVSLYNQAQLARTLGIEQVALWRLGSEDPGVWPALHQSGEDVLSSLSTFGTDRQVDYVGGGEMLKVQQVSQSGERLVSFGTTADTRGLLVDDVTKTFATPYIIERWGEGEKNAVALTFDDGPDAVYTAQMLDILEREGVPGTFFVIGTQALAHPALLRRMVDGGHEIGSHSFSHPNTSQISPKHFELEMNITQRLIENATGHSTRLFRPPYAEDAEPTTPMQANVVEAATRLGYYVSNMNIDPDDWKTPGTGVIVARVMDQIHEGRGQVILLHDAGGNREQTVAALPIIIQKLRAGGYKFQTASAVAGLTRDEANPSAVGSGSVVAWVTGLNFAALGWLGAALGVVFKIGLALGLARLALLMGLALKEFISRRRTAPDIAVADLLSMGVIVPAFNEAKVIEATVASLLASDLPGLRVHVVDDGSTDGTADIIQAAFGNHPRVSLQRLVNGGKARAMNEAMKELDTELVLILDADTQINPEAARLLAGHFHDPRVAAVAGNAKVGNRVNLLTRWQALEYITAQNVERRALAQMNAISVVPGAIGAWRRAVVLELGGFDHDTLAEDADLTMRALRAGYRVTYEQRALAQTEAPETLAALIKQRDRWMFGTLQAVWKQQGAFGSKAYGLRFFTLPNVALFQVIFPLLGALLDLTFVLSLLWGLFQWQSHPSTGFVASGPLIFTGLFILIDLAAAALAFWMERDEDRRLLPLLIPQRFIYRQIMSYVAIRAVLAATQGQQRGWGKLERSGHVQAPVEVSQS
ncbi:glycosyltransferase [Deinococcus marmoris]|uniref:Glycosyltransferase n=1 Tax=Deinococcus marmoris TaxID=249408 RepID=A0A1U7P0N2_9DEIO|nr:glycosyltransferase [Deinococcus marmoris]OLV18729.1 Glycosyltransferase [Deinococcus marmoris]